MTTIRQKPGNVIKNNFFCSLIDLQKSCKNYQDTEISIEMWCKKVLHLMGGFSMENLKRFFGGTLNFSVFKCKKNFSEKWTHESSYTARAK